jgi:site-specific DNA-methyltransferase (adenine-specific)
LAERQTRGGTGDAGQSPAPEGVILADSLELLPHVPTGSVDLIYVDPPFGTGSQRRLECVRTGRGDRSRKGFKGRTYRYEVVSSRQYADDLAPADYGRFLEAAAREMHRVLSGTGSMYLHLDLRNVHRARLVMDDVFGAEHLLNEIIWAYDFGGRARDRWPRKHDNILWYSKSDRWTFNADAVDRVPYLAPGLVGPEKAAAGKLPTDVWWMTIVPTNGRERTGYPTQKPLKLLERIVAASSNEGDLVADFFAGSGTTGVAAGAMGRRFLLVDHNPEAVRIAGQRTGVAPRIWSHL